MNEEKEEREDLRGKSDGSPPQQDSSPGDGEPRNDLWSISGKYITVITLNQESNFYVPREESFPNQLRSFDVTSASSATLDVLLERRIHDYWNIEGDRDLSDAWTGFTRFTISDEKPPEGYTWSGERLTKKQTTSRPDHLWPENLEEHVRRRSTKRNADVDDRKTEARFQVRVSWKAMKN